ncbi:MAG: hypothetical protein IJV80_01580, partial [Clostridia bacterium]|nr:hypothetical protein [Clostridia bacterium]
DSRVGAKPREWFALRNKVIAITYSTAKSAIGNCRAGRAAKGENPLLCAKNKKNDFPFFLFFCVPSPEEDSRVGAKPREWFALRNKVIAITYSTAKSAIDNCRAGRAAKGENPLLCAKKHALWACFYYHQNERYSSNTTVIFLTKIVFTGIPLGLG